MEKKLTMIVPVYDAGTYLRRCLDSILAQTLADWELILVDDGSRDASGAICDEYAGRDARVRVIHKENAGVSSARNAGLAAAGGAYIGFVDADDWIEPEMFEALLERAEETGADIVMCDAVTVYSDGKTEPDTITRLPESVTLNHQDMTAGILLELAGAVWRCIYRAELVQSRRLRFPPGVKFSEDRIFNLYAMGYANRLCYLKQSYYNRFVNCESAVHRFHADYFEACKKAAKGTQEAIKAAWDNDEACQAAYLGQFITGALGAVNNYYYKTSTLNPAERRAAVRAICEDEDIRSAITKSGCGGQRGRWIMNKNVTLLTVYARLANFKHGR